LLTTNTTRPIKGSNDADFHRVYFTRKNKYIDPSIFSQALPLSSKKLLTCLSCVILPQKVQTQIDTARHSSEGLNDSLLLSGSEYRWLGCRQNRQNLAFQESKLNLIDFEPKVI